MLRIPIIAGFRYSKSLTIDNRGEAMSILLKINYRCVLSTVAICLLFSSAALANIANTKHNLSASGQGAVTAVNENRICIFCHTPHHATTVTPLWSRPLSTTIYNLYGSPTMASRPGQPTGASRLCLSCHDGTIAIGTLSGAMAPIEMVGGVTNLPPGDSNLGFDLADDHPISISYTSALASQRGELQDPSSLPPEIQLDDGQVLQCTSCHDPHKNLYGMFLVMSNQNSALCLSCHEKTGWTTSAHSTHVALAEVACLNCHRPHGAPGALHLLKSQAEEGNCLTSCHNGVGNGVDIMGVTGKFYNHPVDYAAGVHEITEKAISMDKHVECVDCHNPHQVSAVDAPLDDPPQVNGRLKGVKGVDIAGTAVAEAASEYEICFNCHADNAFYNNTQIIRLIQETNERLRFDPANPSYHPVAALGKNTNVPSLRPEYSESSRIYCSDCHGSDSSVKVGGTGADGPHGSIYPHILIAQYEQDSYPLSYSVNNYALCFRCHDPDVLFAPGGLTTFSNGVNSSHRTHVIGHGIPCSACHDPHGVPVVRGATVNGNSRLINFDIRFTDPGGVFDFADKSCTVSCHNQGGQQPGYHSYK